MAHQANIDLFNLFGLVLWGDFAELTMYRRDDGRLVIFEKTYPEKPPSPEQQVWQNKFAAAAAAWRALNSGERAQWRTAARRASLPMTGYNLWMLLSMHADPVALATLAKQTNTTLVHP